MAGKGWVLDAQGGDQGRGASATSMQAGCGDEVRDGLARAKGGCGDIFVEYERARGLSLGACQQIDGTDDMGWAGLQPA